MQKTIFRLLLLILLVAIFPATSQAQSFGKIVGVVVDAETGDPLPGANVYLEGTTLGASTDVDGTYVILRVPPGVYKVVVEYIGYQKMTVTNVRVQTDLTTRVDFKLKPETIKGEEVVVVAEEPVIRKDLTSVESRVQKETIQKIPVQDLGDLLNLQAGVVRDAGGGIHIRGGRSTEISYMVNGISITDDFTRSQALQVENESIQELQVISGTFNAEYGNAMSGIINIVTRTGSNKFEGSIKVFSGDYYTRATNIFWHLDQFSPKDIYNFQGSLSGPIIKNKLRFFATMRRWYDDGWLYAPYVYSPQGRVQVINGDTVQVRGDSSAVPMNFRSRISGQFSMEWFVTEQMKLKFDFLGSAESRHNYNHFFRLNPYGSRGEKERGYTGILTFIHPLSEKVFYDITIANKFSTLVSRLYDNPYDPRYVHPDSLNVGAFQFSKAGTDLGRYERYTRSWIGKFSITAQVTQRHQVKLGAEYQKDDVYFDNVTLVPATDENGQQIQPFKPMILPPSSPTHEQVRRFPEKFAAYIQDKIEYEELVINVGVRFDLFNPNGKIPRDLSDPNIYHPFKLSHIYKDVNGDGVTSEDEQRPDNEYTLEEREQFWWRKTRVKTLVSPRLGVAYPISATGVIHFSYGIFQQVPDYLQLYAGDELKVTSATGTQGPFGNPDLNPQRTTMYEIGLKQQLPNFIALDVTGFYRDIRDWISTSQPIPTVLGGVSYVRKINRDFANVRGITLTVRRQFRDHYAFSVDYTFQVAEGTNSYPEQEFFSQLGGAEPTKTLAPLDWDQRHTVNAYFAYGGSSWSIGVTSRFESGQPYTPSIVVSSRTGRNVFSGLTRNSRRKPNRFTVDLNIYKTFTVLKHKVDAFVEVYNLFDARNPVNVYTDTGLPDVTLYQITGVQADPGYFVRPDFYSAPRRIQFGFRMNF